MAAVHDDIYQTYQTLNIENALRRFLGRAVHSGDGKLDNACIQTIPADHLNCGKLHALDKSSVMNEDHLLSYF